MKEVAITEAEEDDEALFILDPGIQKERIRRIIHHQKSLYLSSSSSASSTSSLSSSKRSSLLDLMRGGSTSLGRLFAMEHTSLATHFREYSGSPVVKPICLRGNDEDEERARRFSPWRDIANFESANDGFALDSAEGEDVSGLSHKIRRRRSRRQLPRTKAFRKLPGRFGGIGFRLRRLRIMICGRKL